ncbi:hypothetical protein [Micromonospora sp. NBC_01813]|uniref:hypothetical protein n=1 Tax=Micromonospora sp. NBC_01813 TaxID=2975988 RepID=UPI002DDACCB2|nr:hypothetical protein [Micromonospora sp. NBC_01813]WSA06869.1 hypothetical protein OG958_21650 [Micromonospora sp. NBC_01813]
MTTVKQSSLLQPVVAGGSFRRTATLGWFENDATLAMGYLEAADVLTTSWKAHRSNDSLALPILSLYRHGIELALKAVIRCAARCLRADGDLDTELQQTNLDAMLSATHSIGGLAERLTGYFARLDLEDSQRLPDEVKDVLEALHAVDDSGQWFRYSTVKKRTGKGKDRALVLVPARPDQINFDLEAVAEALHDAGGIVLHGGLGVLDEYAEWQSYLRDAAGW